MRRLEVLFLLIPIKISLKMWGLSDDFVNYMVYPRSGLAFFWHSLADRPTICSLALFLGTGNATPDLPTVMMERLYTSPTYGMWYPIDPKSLSSNLPPMVVFPEASKFYTKWQEDLERRGVNVSLHPRLAFGHRLTPAPGAAQYRVDPGDITIT